MIKQGSKLFSGKFEIKRVLLLAFTAIYFTAVIELHLIISNFVTFPQDFGVLVVRPRNLAFTGSLILLLLMLAYIIYRFIKGSNKAVTVIYWSVSLIYLLVIQKILMVHPIEIAHYLQYGIGALLAAKTIDPDGTDFRFFESFSITALIGTFDEFYQYFYHCPAYCRYLDWMDIWMNIIAAGLGALLVYGFKEYPQRLKYNGIRKFIKCFNLSVLLVFILGFLLFMGDYLKFYTLEKIPPGGILIKDGIKIFFEREIGVYNSWQKTFHTGNFYVPGPELGIAIIFLLFVFYSLFDPSLSSYLKRIILRQNENK